jgi:hypothetical protein
MLKSKQNSNDRKHVGFWQLPESRSSEDQLLADAFVVSQIAAEVKMRVSQIRGTQNHAHALRTSSAIHDHNKSLSGSI